MRRVSGRYVALALGAAALAGWNSRSFGRDLDTDQTKSATGDPTTWNNDLEPTENGTNNNQNGAGNRQARNESDSDSQHHAFLGISMEESDGAVHVTAILPGSPAAKGGLKVGDEIRSVDGDRIRTAQGLTDEVGEKRPGSKVELGIRRKGEHQTLQVRLGTHEEVYGRNSRNNRQVASNDENMNRQNGNSPSGNNQAGGNRRSSSYDPNAQSLNDQLRALQQQVARLQREVDDLRNGNTRVSNRNRSGGTTRDGNDRNSDQDND